MGSQYELWCTGADSKSSPDCGHPVSLRDRRNGDGLHTAGDCSYKSELKILAGQATGLGAGIKGGSASALLYPGSAVTIQLRSKRRMLSHA